MKMNRRKFLKNVAIGTTGIVATTVLGIEPTPEPTVQKFEMLFMFTIDKEENRIIDSKSWYRKL